MEIQHHPEQGEFVASIDGRRAHASYDRFQDRLNIRSTFVPPELRGKGVARELVDAVLDFAEAEGLQAQATCSYAARILEHRGR